ncbi:MAG TPA: hypothetical protein VL947_06010, partial [Cytophagales bacterium]|nr:hypothetical protein [Cytophagales bacterium]
EGDSTKAKNVLDYCLKVMPDKAIPYDVYSPKLALIYLRLGQTNKALEIVRTIAPRATEAVQYYASTNPADFDFRSNLYMLGQCVEVFNEAKSPDEAKKYEKIYGEYYKMVQ